MADKKKVTKKPSGLTISKNDDDFTCQWKLGESYESQTFEYSIATKFNKKGKPIWNTHKNKNKKKVRTWTSQKVKKGTTSLKLKNKSNIAAIAFHVKAKAKKKTACDFVEKVFTIATPNTPTVSASLKNRDTTTFSWQTSVDKTSNKHFVKNVSQQILLDNWNGTAAQTDKKKPWTAKKDQKANGSCDIEEVGWSANDYSHTRFFRIRSIGWAGLSSDWKYASHVYATPNPATNVSATRTPMSKNSNYHTISVEWTSPETAAKPIDTVAIQYVKTVPNVEVTVPEDISKELIMTMSCPNNISSWTEVADAGGVKGSRGSSFPDYTEIPEDQCLYLQVVNKHDQNAVASNPILVKNGVGKIASPGAPIAEMGGVENLYTVSCNRNTTIDDAAIAVYFRTSSSPGQYECIGVIKPRESSTDCIIPDYPNGDSISFGLQTFIGNYSPYSAPEGSTEVTKFSPNPVMSSDIIWGEGVPLPPRDLKVVPVNESTVQVSWKWSWTDATQAELSWADHEDAWESTSEPSTYIVNNTNAGKWNIAGLGIGTWYIRVRLLKTVDDATTYGAYSPIQTVKLASSPDTPSLVLSSGVISKTGSVTCYWAYVSGDGTGQKQGEICEAFPVYAPVENPTDNPYNNVYYERIEIAPETYKYVRTFDITVDPLKTYYKTTGEVTYGDVLRSTDSAQHITLGAEEFNWLPGETHHLAVRVMSMSGELSGGWSAPVPVSIAEELSVEITSTNLTYKTIPVEVEDEAPEESIVQFSMVDFPLTLNINGLTSGGKVTCIIDRADDYHVERPDESDLDGFKGETILIKEYETSAIEINQNDLIGVLDDGASYRITVILNDAYGQSVSTSTIPTGEFNAVEEPEGNPLENGYYVLINDEYVLTTDTEIIDDTTYYVKDVVENFIVHWNHQAIKPTAIVTADREQHITIIRPVMPQEGYEAGDVIDIYRLSVDPPELIYSGALFDVDYVDPYPTFGRFGGHRIVYRTRNGDYITEDNEIAFTDYVADEDEQYEHDLFGVVIDFDGNQLILPYNVSLSNSWKKDYTMTKYLGGSIQGDWNPAVERTMSANTVLPVEYEPENVETLRRLAIYPGICHVRTPDGSNFAANVDVKDDREEKWTTRVSKISLDINKCDPEGFDAMTYLDWSRDQEES